MQDKTIEELRAIREQGDLALAELNRRHADRSDSVSARIQRLHRGDESAKFADTELIYAATVRCDCGAGMAYPEGIGMFGSWTCADILTMRAARGDSPDAKSHTPHLPFSCYSVKSENQPSASGATTRPK